VFVPARAHEALSKKREAFRLAAAESAELRARYEDALHALGRLSASAIEDRLGGLPWPGARPTTELDGRGLIIPFREVWKSAQEARDWAMKRLAGAPTVGIDGSQVGASKEFSVPISLIQVAWFENFHDPERPYVKDVRNEILTADDGEPEQSSFADSRLSRRRFELEMEVAVERIEALAATAAGTPLVLIDGTFVLSFAGRMSPEVRDIYLKALFRLLDASERLRIPVIGFVDLSYASDLTALLRSVFELPEGNVFDAQVLAPRMGPFDRTAAFRCARGDVLPFYRTGELDLSEDLYFVYLETGHARLPARIDFPRWMFEAGLLDRVLDLLRAEIVVGSGYPYPLETADAAAVLTSEDRMSFYRLFHEFARETGLTVSLPAKSISKAHRR
jgi:NurA domain-containing protein